MEKGKNGGSQSGDGNYRETGRQYPKRNRLSEIVIFSPPGGIVTGERDTMTTSIRDLHINDIVQYAVGGDPVAVLANDHNGVTFSNGETLMSGYAIVIARIENIHYMKTDAGTTHAFIGTRAICGTRTTRNTTTVDALHDGQPCKKCQHLID